MSDAGGNGNSGEAATGGSPLHRGIAWVRANMSYQQMQQATIVMLVIALCVYASIKADTFLGWPNLIDNVLTNAATYGIIAVGMSFVMIAGGFDLSVASTTAVCGIVLVQSANFFAPHGLVLALVLAIAITMIVGTALGTINGVLISYVGVNPFVVTLSTMLIFRGIGLRITSGQTMQIENLDLRPMLRQIYWAKYDIFAFPNALLTVSFVALTLWGAWRLVRRLTRYADGTSPQTRGKAVVAAAILVLSVGLFFIAYWVWGPGNRVSLPTIISAAFFAVGIYLLRYTRFGHHIYAIGGNEQATWLAGVNTRFLKAATYAICGFTCAAAAVILVPMASNCAAASSHNGLELEVIASVIVGGTPLGGGSGGLSFTLTGVMLLQIIDNVITLTDVRTEYRKIVTGLIILVVVAIDVLVRKRSRR